MYIPNYDKYKNKDFWFGFVKVAAPIIITTGLLLLVMSFIQPK